MLKLYCKVRKTDNIEKQWIQN